MLFTLALQYFSAETLIVVSGSIESVKSLNSWMSETLESVTWYFYKHAYFNMYWFTTQHMCLEFVVLRNDAFNASLKSAYSSCWRKDGLEIEPSMDLHFSWANCNVHW